MKKLAEMSPGKLILAVRSLPGGRAAMEEILKAYPGTVMDVWELDLGQTEKVKDFPRTAEKELDKVDVLFNNAG